VHDGVTPYFSSSTDNGFPSDHTAFSAVIALAVCAFSRKIGIGLIVLALVIGSARVIAGVHHGQDIIGGFLLGALGVGLGWLVLGTYSRLRSSKT
jgi:undecaprenyl-diphosphatase